MRRILIAPLPTVDENYMYSVGILLPGLTKELGLDDDEDKIAALLRGLYSMHNAGGIHNAALNLQDLDRQDSRSCLQRLHDLRVINEKCVAQIVPPEAMASDH